MRGKCFKLLAAGLAGVVGTGVAFSGTAAAQSPEDVQILLGNAPAAVDELVAGLQEAADVLAATHSAEQTSAAVGTAVVGTASVLVAGTEQFGSLGLGVFLMDQAVQNVVRPYLRAIDDPTTAPGLIDPTDVDVLLANLPGALEEIQVLMKAGLVFLLQGNVIEPPLGFGPAFWSTAVIGTLDSAWRASQGTSIESLFQLLGITSVVAGAALEPQLTELEAALAPLFEAAAPVTGPIIGIIQGL